MSQATAIGFQILQSVFVVLAAPLLVGWVNQCRAWLQNRSAPSILLPYWTLAKLFHKEAVVARGASSLFRATPYILFGCMWLAAGIVPVLATRSEEHTSELQSLTNLVCRLLLEKKKKKWILSLHSDTDA